MIQFPYKMAARKLIFTMDFLKSTSIGGHFPREILDLEQKFKMILYPCTIGYGTTYEIFFKSNVVKIVHF